MGISKLSCFYNHPLALLFWKMSFFSNLFFERLLFAKAKRNHYLCTSNNLQIYPHNIMEITGKIIVAMPEVSGVSAKGNAWKKKEYVLENTEGQFPRKVAFTCFGENADRINLNVGDDVKIYFDIESREYNGRWYTDIRAWRAEPLVAAAPAAPAPGQPAPVQAAAPVPPQVQTAPDDDLFPF